MKRILNGEPPAISVRGICADIRRARQPGKHWRSQSIRFASPQKSDRVKVDWLAANPALWVMLEGMPVNNERFVAWRRLALEAKAAGLYSPKTNLCDINLRPLFEEARKRI